MSLEMGDILLKPEI